MRLCVLVLVFLTSVVTAYAADKNHSPIDDKQKFFTVPKGDIDTPENRSKFAVSMFDRSCVKPLKPQASKEFAQKFMTELTSEGDKAPFMKSVSATAANVFYISVTGGEQPLNNNAKVYGGNAALVLEPSGKCHIVSSGADGDAMLTEMKAYAKGANEGLKSQGIEVTYRDRHTSRPGVKEAWVIFDFPNDTHLIIDASGITPKRTDEISVMISLLYYGPAKGQKAKDLKL